MSAALLFDDYWRSFLAFAAFGVLHSLGAREPFKHLLARLAGQCFVDYFWRLVYCTLSLAALYYAVASLHWARNPDLDVWIIDYPHWLWQLITVAHLGSIVVMYAAFLQSDYFEFLGFKQAAHGILVLLTGRSVAAPVNLFGTHRLVVSGVYAWMRHPMMAAGFWYLLTSGPSLNNISYTVMYAAYMLIGGWYEDLRLARVFGDEYLRYQRRVGAFFPRLGVALGDART